jgi:hypothetical protein
LDTKTRRQRRREKKYSIHFLTDLLIFTATLAGEEREGGATLAGEEREGGV